MELLPGIFGNLQTRRHIGEDISAGKLPHAILLDGPRGSGKRTMAKEIAAALLCENRGASAESLPCRRCEACRKVFEGLCPDVTVLGRNEKAGTIGIDPVRRIRSDMFLSPTEAEEKIYIVEDAHTLTPQAQNALLIVLEEPPPNVRIILLAEGIESLLITVKSRVRRYTMSRFTPEELDEYLAVHSPESARLKAQDPKRYAALLQGADGTIGAVLSMLEPSESEELMSSRETVDRLVLALISPAYSKICDAVSYLPSSRAEMSQELILLQSALRDLVLLRSWGDIPLSYYTDREEALSLSGKLPRARICKISDGISEILQALERNGNVTVLQARLRDLFKSF